MDPDTLRRAWEPFFSTKPTGKGSGLGLSMVHGLMLQSGAAVEMTSRPNEGTAVSLWLPVAPESLLRKDGAAGSELPAHTSRRILLVDDDPLVLTVTADMLRELGHQPMEMASAHKALEVLRAGERCPISRFLTMQCLRCRAWLWRMLCARSVPTYPCSWRPATPRGRRRRKSPRLDKPYTIAELARQIGLLIAK